MTLPNKPNIRRIAFQRQCYEELEVYLNEHDMKLNHKEFLLDLAALIDFLEGENYIGAHYIATVLLERLKTKLPEWEKLAKLHVPKDWEVPVIEHGHD
jgi:hypothetical protein